MPHLPGSTRDFLCRGHRLPHITLRSAEEKSVLCRHPEVCLLTATSSSAEAGKTHTRKHAPGNAGHKSCLVDGFRRLRRPTEVKWCFGGWRGKQAFFNMGRGRK